MRTAAAAVTVMLVTLGCGGPDDAAPIPPTEGCGDGIVDPGEACDGAILGASCDECEMTCWPSWDDCNQDDRDGCEVELARDSNCGACGIECGDAETCVMGGCGEIVATGQGYIRGAATSDRLVWATYHLNYGSGAPPSTVRVLDTVTGDVAVLADDLDPVEAITADEEYVYLLQAIPNLGNTSTRISRIPLDGGALVTVVSGTSPSPRWLEVDDTHVYWSNGYYDLLRAPKDGGEPEGVASSQGSPRALAGVDSTSVYWGQGGWIFRGAKDGTGIEVLHMGISSLGGDTSHLDLDSTSGIIYVLGSEESEPPGGIVAAPTDGAPAMIVSEGVPVLCDDRGGECFTNYFGPSVVDGAVYWSAQSFARVGPVCELVVAALDLAVDPPETRVLSSFRGCDYSGIGGGVVATLDDAVYLHVRANQGALLRQRLP